MLGLDLNGGFIKYVGAFVGCFVPEEHTNLVLRATGKTCAPDLDYLDSRSRSAVYHQVALRSCPLRCYAAKLGSWKLFYFAHDC